MEEKNTKLDLIDKLMLAFLILLACITVFLFFTTDVHATTQSNSLGSSIYTFDCGDTSTTYNRYCVYVSGQTNAYTKKSLNTTYSGVANGFQFSWQSTMAQQHTITINGMSTDFRNNNFYCAVYGSNTENSLGSIISGASCSYVSKSKIVAVIPPNSYRYHTIDIEGWPLTGISTYGIKSIVDSWDDGQQDFSGIIDSQNQNTQDIIDNNNSNTLDIISKVQDMISNDQELHDQLMQAQTCPSGPLSINYSSWGIGGRGYLNSDGSINSGGNGALSPYFEIIPRVGLQYVITSNNSISGAYACVYTSSQTVIACYQMNTTSLTINASNRTSYIRFSINKNTSYTLSGPVCNDWEKEAQQHLEDAMTNDNVDSGVGSDFFNNFDTSDNGGISSIVTKPLVLINNLLSSNSSCSNLQLTIPGFVTGMDNTNVSLPSGCSLWNQAPQPLITLWNTLVIGVASYLILKNLFNLINELKNPDDDRVEVIDL